MSYTITDRRHSSGLVGYDGRPIDLSATDPTLTIQAAAGSFQGTDSTTDRGMVYCPTMESKKEVDAWSRAELNKRANVLYNSGGGLVHRLTHGTADMICGTGMIPHPTPTRVKGREGKIREWVNNVRQLYMQRAGSKGTYDMAKRRNVFQDQRLAVRLKIKDGDSAKIFVRDVETGRLRTIRYEANQIGNGPTTTGIIDKSWCDGIKCGAHNQMLAIRINVTGDDNKVRSTDIPAANVLHFMTDERLHQVRGLTRFYPVLNKLFDRGEIQYALTKGIKVASQPAYVIETAARDNKQVAGAPGTTLPKSVKVVDLGNGKKVNFTDFMSGGEAWGLQPGQSFKIVQSQNPHPNVADYLQEMIRDICHTIGVAPEIAWNIIDAGGANMRFIQAGHAQFIEIEQDELVDNDLGPHYVAWLYDMIVAGEVEEIDGWERHVWIAPARLTVDFGRDGKLYIEELKRGIRTMQSMYGMRGEIAEVGIDTYLDERLYIVQGIHDRKVRTDDGERSLTYEEAFPEQRQQTMIDPTDISNQVADQQAQQAELLATEMKELRDVIAYAREPK